jgi:hypothetical protein
MLMSLPELCHSGRTPTALLLSVMADVIPLLLKYAMQLNKLSFYIWFNSFDNQAVTIIFRNLATMVASKSCKFSDTKSQILKSHVLSSHHWPPHSYGDDARLTISPYDARLRRSRLIFSTKNGFVSNDPGFQCRESSNTRGPVSVRATDGCTAAGATRVRRRRSPERLLTRQTTGQPAVLSGLARRNAWPATHTRAQSNQEA